MSGVERIAFSDDLATRVDYGALEQPVRSCPATANVVTPIDDLVTIGALTITAPATPNAVASGNFTAAAAGDAVLDTDYTLAWTTTDGKSSALLQQPHHYHF